VKRGGKSEELRVRSEEWRKKVRSEK